MYLSLLKTKLDRQMFMDYGSRGLFTVSSVTGIHPGIDKPCNEWQVNITQNVMSDSLM